MSNLSVVIAATRVHAPIGVSFDHIEISIKDAAGVTAAQSLGDNGGTSFSTSFSNVADGTLTYSIAALDSTGNAIGTPLTGSFNTLAGVFPSPTGVTFTVS
jgi:hypothetical protein